LETAYNIKTPSTRSAKGKNYKEANTPKHRRQRQRQTAEPTKNQSQYTKIQVTKAKNQQPSKAAVTGQNQNRPAAARSCSRMNIILFFIY
jgi:hypothetical protein